MGERKDRAVSEFQGRPLPEPGKLAGYAALIQQHRLRVPLPPLLAFTSERHTKNSTDQWLTLTARHAPEDTLGGHITFALKWEGVQLGVLVALFKATGPEPIREFIAATPTGAYARRLWFLYEWLTGDELDLPSLGKVKAVPVLDTDLQYGVDNGEPAPRQKVINNLPGTRDFCPLVRRTDKLEKLRQSELAGQAREISGRTHPDILARAAAFLLLSDSKSSFQIEGEQPPAQRIVRWGRVIAEAGQVQLSRHEFERLQRIVIGDTRFVHVGLRTEGGFVGVHDRSTSEPIPDHISARPEDLQILVDGLAALKKRSLAGAVDPVIAAAAVAFGFVYIHPFEDGNGRLHRWLIHHVLAKGGFNPPGLVFPISAVILRRIGEYRRVLESYSKPLLDLIDWRPTLDGNVEVLNETADFYRYFDATLHAEFLFECVDETIKRDLPNEVRYLQAYDKFVSAVESFLEMPKKKVDLLWRFLDQNNGKLSARARAKEFAALRDEEVSSVERAFAEAGAGTQTPEQQEPAEVRQGERGGFRFFPGPLRSRRKYGPVPPE
jgi:Fic family protein